MKDLYIQDTAEVFLTSLVTGNIVGVGYAQVSGLSVETDEEDIRGGIGNKLAYTIRSSKDITLNITSATFKPEFIAMQQGTDYKEGVTKDVTKNAYLFAKEDGGDIYVEATEAMGDIEVIRAENLLGKQVDVEIEDDRFVLPDDFGVEAGDEIEVFYFKSVTGRSIDFDATKFGTKYKVEYNTICYDRETQDVYSDLYFEFPEASPSANFEMSFENGSAFIPEMEFKVTAPKGSDVLGTKMEVLREDTP